MQSNETTTSAMGGGGGEGEGCRGGESSRKYGVLKKNIYVIPYTLLQDQILKTQSNYFYIEACRNHSDYGVFYRNVSLGLTQTAFYDFIWTRGNANINIYYDTNMLICMSCYLCFLVLKVPL